MGIKYYIFLKDTWILNNLKISRLFSCIYVTFKSQESWRLDKISIIANIEDVFHFSVYSQIVKNFKTIGILNEFQYSQKYLFWICPEAAWNFPLINTKIFLSKQKQLKGNSDMLLTPYIINPWFPLLKKLSEQNFSVFNERK